MIDYSARIMGAINHRSSKQGEYLAVLAGCQGNSRKIVAKVINEFNEKIPDYLTGDSIKDLKNTLKPDLQNVYNSRYLDREPELNTKIFNRIYQLFQDHVIDNHQAMFLLTSIGNVYNWWYQSDEELRDIGKEFMEGRYLPPVLDSSAEPYKGSHHPDENLFNVLIEEQVNIDRYNRDNGLGTISVPLVIEALQKLKEWITSPIDDMPSVPSFVNELVGQFKRVRARDPEMIVAKAIANPQPENYMMSSRGNNYNTDKYLKEYVSRVMTLSKIPTAVGSLFRYDSKFWNINSVEQINIDSLPIIHNYNYDSYTVGFGKKNGGKFRVFYYTSPQNSMVMKVASDLIQSEQKKNPFQAYTDQSLGQKELDDPYDKIGVDSTEYSDHQTVLLLKFVLELYGFGELAENLAWMVHLPIFRGYDDLNNPVYTLPPNGSVAGGKLDVALINDAAQVICFVYWYITKLDIRPWTCGDDWTKKIKGTVTEKDFLLLHALCTCFNQITNPDKTEWLKRDGFIGFCRIKYTIRHEGENLLPASGMPASTWQKVPVGLRDLSQAIQFLVKAKYLDLLFPSPESRRRLVDDLFRLWKDEIQSAWEILSRSDEHVTSIEDRFDNAKHIPLDIGGLATEIEDYSYSSIIDSAMNGLDRMILSYRPFQTSIARFIQVNNLTGRFARHLSEVTITSSIKMITVVTELKAIKLQYETDRIYNHKDLKKIMSELSVMLLDYNANSDGVSRKSTKDRSTETRDPDIFLDNIANSFNTVSIVDREMTLPNLSLLDSIMANPSLSTAGAMQSFNAIVNDLDYLKKTGKILSYSGYGDHYGDTYPCIAIKSGIGLKKVRLWNIDPGLDREKNGSFIPLNQIRDTELHDFVANCRQLIFKGALSRKLAIQRGVIKEIIESDIRKMIQERKDISEETKDYAHKILDDKSYLEDMV